MSSALGAAPPPPPPDALLRAVAARYAGASRWAQGYVRSKLRSDPATRAVLALAAERPFGRIVDLGCGRGQLGLALLAAGLAEHVTGLDRDSAKLAEARAAAAGLPAEFRAADFLAAGAVPACDTVLLIDVLYQLPESVQRTLLGAVAAAARRRVVIRAFDPDRGWRSAAGHAMEQLGRLLRGDLGRAAIRPLPADVLAAPLRAAGLTRVAIAPCWAGTPLPNILLVAERDTTA